MMKRNSLFILTVIFINFFAIGRSLQFSLSGDDWLALYRYIITFHTFSDHFNIFNYMGNYDAANILMGLLYRLLDFNPFPYYLTSLGLRIIASLSFFYPIIVLTRNRLAAYLSVIFFSFSYIGIESTNWVFNMTTYISISLFNFFLYLYIKNKATLKSVFVQSTVVFLAFFFAPNRMHALIFILPLLEILRYNFEHVKKIKLILFRVILILVPIFFFRRLTASDWDQAYLEMARDFLSKPVQYILYYVGDVGAAAIPDRILFIIFENTDIVNLIKMISGFFLLVFLTAFFFVVRKKYPTISLGGILSIFFSLSFLVAPWLIFSSGGTFSSDSRYLTIPGAYLIVSVALLITILWQEKKAIYSSITTFITILLAVINLISFNDYFNFYLLNGRNVKESNAAFSQLVSYVKPSEDNNPIVVLVTPDNPSYLYNSIAFGFTYRIILVDKRFGIELRKAPFIVDNIDSLINVLSDKNSSELKRYGYNPMEIPLENVYAFVLQNKNLSDSTAQIRNYLKEKIQRK